MSIEAINWAMRQRLRGCAPQCLLFVLANAADPEGVAFGWWKSADHWWPYLIRHTRLARATIFGLLRELEEVGLISRNDQIAPDDGGNPQPVIRLHLDKLIEQAMPSERPRAASAAESQSTQWTEKTEQGGISSPANGLENTGLAPVEVHPVDSFESTPWTGKESLKENPSTPKPPSRPAATAEGLSKKASSQAVAEPIGFASFWSEYPEHELDNRVRAVKAYVALSEMDRRKAADAVGLYARDIRERKRKPVGAARWLSERRFAEYAPGAHGIGQRVFVREGTEAWRAWCGVASLAFGGDQKIPTYWAGRGPHGEHGALCPAAWPLGGEGWLVPLDQWIFVVADCAQFHRWNERVHEIMGRGVMLRASFPAKYARRRVIAKGGLGWDGLPSDVKGILVPSEWPPAKGERASATGPPSDSLMTQEDHEAPAEL